MITIADKVTHWKVAGCNTTLGLQHFVQVEILACARYFNVHQHVCKVVCFEEKAS